MTSQAEKTRRRNLAKRNYRHGLCRRGAEAPEYNVWRGIKKRCCNPTDKDFPRYGGRGIRVCRRWLSSFAAFMEDMGARPSPHHQIERKNNNGNYTPENCKWATASEQARNRRSNIIIEHRGRRRTLVEWSEETGIGITTLFYRIGAGWSVEATLSKTPRRISGPRGNCKAA